MKFRNLSYLIVILFVSLIAFYSCQKEPNEKLNRELSSKDPKAFSSSIKVWHGIRTPGNPPAQKDNSLQLDNTTNSLLYAIAGRYAIIQPRVIAYDVAGYYLKVDGASDYFKVDYTKPRNTGRQIKQRNARVFGLDSAGGNLDSAIVIVLPSNLHVPDTICMTYWAYDNSGNVSNPVAVCIVISSLGSDANGAWLNGVWRPTAGWENGLPHDTLIYNNWLSGGFGEGYDCNGGTLQLVTNNITPGQTYWATDSVLYQKLDFTLDSNGGLSYDIHVVYKSVNSYNSTCNNIVSDTMDLEEKTVGAWSYNSGTHKLIIVFEFDDTGSPIEEAYEFDVVQVDNKNVIWIDNTNSSNPYYNSFQKL